MLLGPRITTVFTSRWKALFWAAGVLFSAWCFVPTDTDDGGGPQDAEAVQAAVQLAGGSANSAAAPAGDPWKK